MLKHKLVIYLLINDDSLFDAEIVFNSIGGETKINPKFYFKIIEFLAKLYVYKHICKFSLICNKLFICL